ncbi:Cobalt-zinc-cadmium resistance protein CzcB [bacterium HR32]|jgi:RND family efflux transporter MFP subunit|nr:Cobalt-zinc-cadmium resistance protein CzcB [bacterium HR32]
MEPEADVRRMAGLVLVVAAAVVGLLWSLGIGFPRAPQPVDAARVRRGDLEVVLAVTGVFESRAADLAFSVPGRLVWTVPEGTAARRGEPLARLDAGELEAAAEQARHTAQAADGEAERAAAQVAAAAAEVERARAAWGAARAQVRQALFGVRAAQANLDRLRSGARPAEVQQAEAAVAAARAAWEQARRNAELQDRLLRDGAVSQAQRDAARAEEEAARARLEQAEAFLAGLRRGASPEELRSAEAQVAQARSAHQVAVAQVEQALAGLQAARSVLEQAQAALAAAKARAAAAHASWQAALERLEQAVLRAPFDGVATRVYVQPGATVGPSLPVLSFAAPGGWVVAEVDEADVGRVRVGQRARVTADAYPGVAVGARVSRVGGQVEVRAGARVVRVRLELARPVPFRVGTSVDVDLLLRTVPQVLLVPAEAVVSVEDGGAQVYVVEGGVARVRRVRTGERNDRYAAVLEGLREGELVALAEPGRLRDGQRVVVRSVQ